MIKFASELILKPVIMKREHALVGIVEDLVMNPDNGELVGILVREGFGKKNLKTLATKDIISITTDYYLISEYESLGELDEIVRVKKVLELGIKLVGSKVVTVLGIVLGRVRDYTVNTKSLHLDKLYVDQGVFRPLARELLISFPQIVSIEKDVVTVADASIKETKAVRGQLPETATG